MMVMVQILQLRILFDELGKKAILPQELCVVAGSVRTRVLEQSAIMGRQHEDCMGGALVYK